MIPVGGHQFTNDLSVGLRLQLREAERVKIEHGFVADDTGLAERIEATVMDGSTAMFRSEAIRNILEPRSCELFEMVAREVRPHLFDTSGTCAVLTGGASCLRGLDRVAGAVMGIPARVGASVNGFTELDAALTEDPANATGIGLLLYAREKEARDGAYVLGALGRKIKGIARFFSGRRGKGYAARKHVLAEPRA